MGEKIAPITSDCSKELQYIGMRIQYFRKMRNLTQAQLAEKVSINKNYLSQIESGSTSKAISLPLLIQISKALDVELSILVELKDMEKSIKEIRQQLDEIKSFFDEVKRLNSDLDDMIAEMDKSYS
ncbi:MAG: helix-turn-helix transcriptional regulator [Selenomonadaceae bacterium]|nr:helix-turn-helix transcriptional regulator [Selenomonadaceae bacterium]